MNITSILEELNAQEDIKINYSAGRYNKFNDNYRSSSRATTKSKFDKRNQKVCAYCKAINRTPSVGHDVKSCWVIPKEDKHNLIKAFSVLAINSDCSGSEESSESVKFVDDSGNNNSGSIAEIQRVECIASPYFFCYIGKQSCKVTVDCGATSKLSSLKVARSCGLKIEPSRQHARQLDGTPLRVCGEVKTSLHYGSAVLHLHALVIEVMDADILGGTPFCKSNA